MSFKTRVLATGDGAWAVPASGWPQRPLCYCVGIGRDAGFDTALASELGAQVYSFDPTPSSIEYMEAWPDRPVEFRPWGLWDEDTTLTLYRQDRGDEVNLSAIDPGPGRGGAASEVKVRRLASVMRELGHEHLDLLKLDVEGAWYRIIADLHRSGIAPGVLCVEFDSPTGLLKVRRTVRRLRDLGLRFVERRRDDWLFVSERFQGGGA